MIYTRKKRTSNTCFSCFTKWEPVGVAEQNFTKGPYLLKFVLQTCFEDSYFLQNESSKWCIIDLALTLVAFEKQ